MVFDRKAYIRNYMANRRAGRPQPLGKLRRYESALRFTLAELKDTKSEKGKRIVSTIEEALGEE